MSIWIRLRLRRLALGGAAAFAFIGGAAHAAGPLPLADFFRHPAFVDMVMSTNGLAVAATATGASGRVGLVVLDLRDLSKSTNTATFSDVDVGSVRWVNDERLVFDVTDRRLPSGDQLGSGLFAVYRGGKEPVRQLIQREWQTVSPSTNIVDCSLAPNHRLRTVLSDGSSDVLIERVAHHEAERWNGTTLMRLNSDAAARRQRPCADGRAGARRPVGAWRRMGRVRRVAIPRVARLRFRRAKVPRQHRLRRQALPRRIQAVGQAMQDDVAGAALWAVKQGHADAKRVCIAGASYGGHATLMGLIRNPELFRCGVQWVGVTDIDLIYSINWSDFSEQWKDHGMPLLVGDRVEDAAQLAATSPLKRAAELKQPLLMACGGRDLRVPINHGTRMRDALKPHNRNIEWIDYPSEGHGRMLAANDVDFWTRVEKFLERNLQRAP